MDFDFIELGELNGCETPVLPAPELVNYYKDLDDRIIWLDDEVGANSLNIIKNILRWNAQDEDKCLTVESRKPIKLLIFSPGGELEVCNAIVDVIELSKTPVWGINMGMAMSAAFYIQLACHRRLCTKNSIALIHKGAAAMQGNASDVISSIESYKTQLNRLKETILAKTNITSQLYNKRSKEDWYVFAKDQLKYGIVEKIIDDINEII